MAWLDARTWGSTEEERALPFACDRYLDAPVDALFRAVSVEAPAALLFRWLCQLRVAPYSYDWIDNFGRRSPDQLTPGLDDLRRGQPLMTIFELVDFERPRHLTLRTRPSRILGQFAVTYAVVNSSKQRCRLVVKLLVAWPDNALSAPLRRLLPVADLFMMRKQLLTLKRLAERDAVVGGGLLARSGALR
jgi:hypothetical protein